MPDCDVVKRNRKRILISPSKQEQLSSAKLLKLKYKPEHYQGLKLMIKTAVKEFR